MPTATLVPITGSVLTWAMNEAEIDDQELARRCRVDTGLVQAWRHGDEQPTKTQFKQLANALRRPTSFFFLPSPPATSLIPASFRSPPGKEGDRELSVEEARALRTARRLQRISAWAAKERGDGPVKLPRLPNNLSPETAANQARDFLEWTVERQLRAFDAGAVAKDLRRLLEDHGLLVMQLSLGEKGCRGFSLYDDYAPLIAINSTYNNPARTFSYVHELGHLLMRSDSICTSTLNRNEERWCEEFAASFLLPRSTFSSWVKQLNARGRIEDFELVRRLANRFKVSLRAVALRLINLEYADFSLYEEVDERADFKTKGGGGRGETRPQRRLRQWGRTYPRLLLGAERDGLLSRQDVLEYLNLPNTQLHVLQEELASADWDEA